MRSNQTIQPYIKLNQVYWSCDLGPARGGRLRQSRLSFGRDTRSRDLSTASEGQLLVADVADGAGINLGRLADRTETE